MLIVPEGFSEMAAPGKAPPAICNRPMVAYVPDCRPALLDCALGPTFCSVRSPVSELAEALMLIPGL